MAHLHHPQQPQQTTHPSFHQPQYVTVLGANDVLLGRGSGPNDHEGNIQFRKYVAERKQAYMATNHRLTKTKIAREIVDLVARAGGRFLKKLEETPEQEVYEIVSDETVMEKAKQALRQNAGKKDGVAPVPSNTTGTTTAVNSLPLTLGDLEPIPFTDAGYSGPPPAATATQGEIAAVWQLQQQQQQAVATAAFQQQQQRRQQQQQQQPNLFEQQLQQQQQQQSAYGSFAAGGGGGGVQPYPYHQQQQQQQRQMPPPLMRIPSIPTDQQQQQQLYGYSTSTDTSSSFVDTSAKSLTPSLVSSEGSGSVGGGSGPQSRGRMNHKRASLTIADLSDPRRPTNHTARSSSGVEDLTDSFSKLNASTDNAVQNKMMASSDTMGTIDYHETSMADMSINSSTFSIFKGAYGDNSSVALELPNATARNQQFLLHSQQPHRNTISSPEGATIENNNRDSSSSTNRTRDSGDSMSFTDLFEKGGKSSSLSCSIGGLMHDIRRQVESEMGGQSPVRTQTVKPEDGEDEQHHPTLGPLRASSLDVVKSLLPTESEAAELGLQQQQEPSSQSGQPEQQQSSQQQRQAYYRQDPNRKAEGV